MAIFIPGGLPPAIIEPGFPVVLARNIGAVQTVANAGASTGAISATGVEATNPFFTLGPSGISTGRTLNLSARGVGAVPTTVSAQVYKSTDGGTTWSAYGAAVPLIVAGVATDGQVVNLVDGPIYQVLVPTLTLGGATGVNVDGALS